MSVKRWGTFGTPWDVTNSFEQWLELFETWEGTMSPEERVRYNEEALKGHNLADVEERARVLMTAANADYFSEVPRIAKGPGDYGETAARLASELLLMPVTGNELRSGGIYDIVLDPAQVDRKGRPERFATVFWSRVWSRQ